MDAGGKLLTFGRDMGWDCLGQGEGVHVSAVPRLVAGLGGVRVRTVAVGYCHTLACSDEGVTCSFGRGEKGQLGHGNVASQHTPRVIEALQGVHISVVAAGEWHSLALSREGKLYSFGFGHHGQLGHGDTAEQLTPRLVAELNGVCISAVAAGRLHSLALSKAVGVYSFGSSAYGQLGHASQADQPTPRLIASLQGVRVSSLAAGGEHSLVVSTAGKLYSFGRGGSGALGHGDRAEQPTPRLVAALQGVRIMAVAAGESHSLALSKAGEIYSFGNGTYGRLGHGGQTNQLTPRAIAGLQGLCMRSVVAGYSTSLTVTTDGEAYGWGTGSSNLMFGLELTEPQLVPLKCAELRLLA